MRNILVVNINWLGDAIFSTPVFKALKQAYPQARISCLCVPRVREVMRHCPHVDDIIVYDEEGRDRWVWRKLFLVHRLRRAKFDAAFVLHRSLTRGFLVYLAGIPQRIGYGKAHGLLTHPVQSPGDDVHRSDYYLRVVEGYGIPISDRRCQLRLAAQDMTAIGEILKAQGIGTGQEFIVFNAGGNWPLKRWPSEFWSHLAQRVHGQTGLAIVFSGAANDRPQAQKIMEDAAVAAVNLAGQTSLGQSLALFRRAKLVVSGDSGPLHLADSVGARVVGIYGPTRTEITGPRGMGEAVVLFKDVGCNKAPCYHLSCQDNVCMQGIGVEDVWQAVRRCIG